MFTDSTLKEELQLTKPEDFYYLNRSGCFTVKDIDDSKDFKELQDAMDMIGFTKQEQTNCFQILAGILHLGNIKFSPTKEGSQIANKEVAKVAASLLKMKEKTLESALTTKTIAAGGRQSVYHSFLDVKQAEYARDALAKAVYGKMFDWVVQKINSSILKKEGTVKSKLVIGILDIYGFEIFEHNSFEQLCINYVNEKLQQVFIELTLKAEQEEYDKEGIKWTPVKYENNKPCVDMIDKKQGGIFALLNETCLLGGDDKQFCEKLTQQLKSNSFFDGKKKDYFTLKHYAGDVLYNPVGFTDKNSDQLFQSIIESLRTSENGLLSGFFAEEGGKGKKEVSKRPTSVSVKFIDQVDELMKKLYACQPHYIRCLKPNSEKRANYYVDQEMKHQIRYLGLLENVKVRRAGFVYRQTFDFFFTRYRILNDKTYPKYNGSFIDGCKLIMESVVKSQDNYQFGKTKIFIKVPEIVYNLEELRERKLHDIAQKIQRLYRRYKARQFYIEMKEKSLGIFGTEKKRRRISVNRNFAGDYLEMTYVLEVLKCLQKNKEEDSKIYFSNHAQKVSKTLFGYGTIEFHPKFIFMNSKSFYLFAGKSPKKPGFKEKFDIATIESVTLSPGSDGFLLIRCPDKLEYLFECDSKTELISVLCELYEKLNNKKLTIQFESSFVFNIKKKIPLNVKIVEDPKTDKSVLKHVKTDLTILTKAEKVVEYQNIKKSNKPTSKKVEVKKEETKKVESKKEESTKKMEVKKEETKVVKKEEQVKRTPPPRPVKRERVIAIYDFVGQDQDELTLKEGDIIEIIVKGDEGWWKGVLPNGKEGLFPSNYVEAYDK